MSTLAEIEQAVAKVMQFAPDERQRLLAPYMGFLMGVETLSDDQVLHLITMMEYDATLTELATERAAYAQTRARLVATEKVAALARDLERCPSGQMRAFIHDHFVDALEDWEAIVPPPPTAPATETQP